VIASRTNPTSVVHGTYRSTAGAMNDPTGMIIAKTTSIEDSNRTDGQSRVIAKYASQTKSQFSPDQAAARSRSLSLPRKIQVPVTDDSPLFRSSVIYRLVCWPISVEISRAEFADSKGAEKQRALARSIR